MAWTTPATVLAGSTELTAALWNEQVRDNATAIRAAQVNVVQVTKSNGNVTSTGGTEQTVLTLNITPSSSDSKILLLCSAGGNAIASSNAIARVMLYRSTTQLLRYDQGRGDAGTYYWQTSLTHLDSPASTSQQTYTFRINRGSGGTSSVTCVASDSADGPRLVAMEIAV